MHPMKLLSLRTLAGGVALACSLLAHGATVEPAAIDLKAVVPVGPQVKVGKLANGLTYYIQKNSRPEKRLELRLVVKAGSILEDDDQQGLAHFTEHMAFNGSAHFKRHELVSYLQSIGVKFGADLNAYTSFDETVYILPIPTEKPEVVEQGFQVLEDWAHGLSLNDADIDSERGIVLEELRLGKGVDDRFRKVLLPKVFNGSRYADRLPIGKEEILKNFKYDAIKRFYHDWYRPDLMAVVVVGDIEPAEAQKLVERHFAGMLNPPNERPRVATLIPERNASEGLALTDKEASVNALGIRYPLLPHPRNNTFGEYRQNLIESLYFFILSQRMYELTQQANPPFIQGGSGIGSDIHGYRAFQSSATLGKGGAAPAIKALVEENERARQFGFTASEVERAKKGMLRNYERMYSERDKSNSSSYVGEYTRSFLDGESIPGIENEYRYVNQLLPGITLDEINAAARKAIPSGQGKLVIYTGTDRADTPPPKADELLAAVNAAEKAVVKAQQEKVYASKLMDRPRGGSIVQQSRNDRLGTTELTLSNGVRVVLKPTDFNNDQVLLSAQRFGGQSLFEDKDILNARYLSSIVGQMGVLDYSPNDLVKVMAGKSAGVSVNVGPVIESLNGHSGKSDIEAMLQLAWLEMTQPRKDVAIYNSFIGKQRDLAQNSMSRPEAVFADTIARTMFNGHPRQPLVPRPEDFDHIQLDRVMEMYRSRLSSAAGFTFYLVGSFDVETVKPLLAAYLGGLPAAKVPLMYQDWGVRPVRGVVKKEVRAGSEAKSMISLNFTGEARFSPQEQIRLEALLEVLNIKLIEVLREKMGMIYGGGVQGSLSKVPYENFYITVNLPTGPENVDKVIAATFAEIQKVKDNGVEPEDLAKVKAAWLTNYRRAMRENGYWMGQLRAAQVNGTDPEALLNYEARVAEVTPQELKLTAQRYFDTGNYVQAVLYPASAPAASATATAGDKAPAPVQTR
jgi:zinc protease